MFSDDWMWWKLLVFTLVAGMLLGWAVFDGLPLLWQMAKPWLHSLTA